MKLSQQNFKEQNPKKIFKQIFSYEYHRKEEKNIERQNNYSARYRILKKKNTNSFVLNLLVFMS